MILSKTIFNRIYVYYICIIMILSILILLLNSKINYYGFLCGVAAFSSNFFVLEKVARYITNLSSDANKKRPGIFHAVLGVFFKLVFPIYLIWFAVVQLNSIIEVFLGVLVGLIGAAGALFLKHKSEDGSKFDN